MACAAAVMLFLLVFGGFSIISFSIIAMMMLRQAGPWRVRRLLINKLYYCNDDAFL
jgi:hypothetical protein